MKEHAVLDPMNEITFYTSYKQPTIKKMQDEEHFFLPFFGFHEFLKKKKTGLEAGKRLEEKRR